MKTKKDFEKKFAENFLKNSFSLLFAAIVLCVLLPQTVFATPAIPVDRDEFSIGNTITAEFTAYGVKSQHTGYKEDNKNAKIFYTRTGKADPGQPLRFILTAKQSLPGTVQELEFTAQPFDVVNRYAGKPMDKFYRKVTGSAGKRLNVNVEYKIPPKARLLVVTAQLKDFYREGNKTLPRYTTVEYELRVVGYGEANATPFSGKSVKKVYDSKGKRTIIEDKHSDAITAAIGIGGSFAAAFVYWLLHKLRKKKNAEPGSAPKHDVASNHDTVLQPDVVSKQDTVLNQSAVSVRPGFSADSGTKNAPQFCSNCGAKLEPGAAFCGNCGTKV